MVTTRRENCVQTPKRDVWRVPIEFSQ
jgi:hypothetical protein